MHGFGTSLGHGGWLAQLAALLLIIAMFGHASIKLRIGVLAAALLALYYGLSAGRNPVIAVWAALLIAVCLIKIAQFEWKERRMHFTPGEEHLRSQLLTGLAPTDARALIDAGIWVTGKPGERLLSEGQPATHLYFLHSGSARVSFSGTPVGACNAGNLIGDATATSGGPATATVDLTERSELWCIWADELRQYIALHPAVRSVLERRLNDALRDKLSSANQRLAGANS